MKIWLGCAGFAIPLARYFERFQALEVQESFYEPPQPPALRRWRTAAPKDFVFAVRAWQLITHEPKESSYKRLKQPIPKARAGAYGFFRRSEEVGRAWERTASVCDALDARFVVFDTPPSFTPTTGHREQLERFFSDIDRKGRALVWRPHGVWEPRVVKAICKGLDLVHAVDPLRERPTTPSPAYFSLQGFGATRGSYGDSALEKVAVQMAGFDEVYAIFGNPHGPRDAAKLADLFAELSLD